MEKKDIKNTCEGRGWTYTDKWGGAPMPGCRVSAFVEEWGSVRPAAVAIVLRPLEGGAWSASEVGHGSLGVVEREGDLVEAVERAKENYLERVGRPVGVATRCSSSTTARARATGAAPWRPTSASGRRSGCSTPTTRSS